jgi:hypothetical protein
MFENGDITEIEIEPVAVSAGLFESWTLRLTVGLPAVVGVPEISPLLLDVNPAGSDVMVQM